MYNGGRYDKKCAVIVPCFRESARFGYLRVFQGFFACGGHLFPRVFSRAVTLWTTSIHMSSVTLKFGSAFLVFL